MLFYFTGTGNCLYAAKQLESDPISIPQVIHQENLVFEDEKIGIVAPVYGHEVPPMVKEFMHKATFKTDYFYMVLTYGNRHGGAALLAKQLCAECGIEPAYINVLLMVDNWLPAFDMDEQRQIDKKVESQLAAIKADLDEGKRMISKVTEEDIAAHQGFVERMASQPSDAWQHLLKVTEKCIGCGICAKVCPSASMRIVDGKAVHTPGNCQTCLACIHACPQNAISLTVPEKNPNARYRNEHITLQEIIKANQQA